MGLPRAEVAELVVLVALLILRLRVAEQCPQREMDGLARIGEMEPAYRLLDQIVIDFAAKRARPMQLSYAAENLTPLAPEHFLSRKATDLASIKQLAKGDPAALVRNILESLDGKATVAQIGEWLVGDVFTEAEWKRW